MTNPPTPPSAVPPSSALAPERVAEPLSSEWNWRLAQEVVEIYDDTTRIAARAQKALYDMRDAFAADRERFERRVGELTRIAAADKEVRTLRALDRNREAMRDSGLVSEARLSHEQRQALSRLTIAAIRLTPEPDALEAARATPEPTQTENA